MSRVEVNGYAAIMWGFVAAAALGTVPAVGGYSNTTPRGDFTTVGIVTQVEGGAFIIRDKRASAHAVRIGIGVGKGDRVWVEEQSLARVTDLHGGWVTIAGPAAVQFSKPDTVVLYKGSAKFKSAPGRAIHFESGYAAGTISGEGALWASSELTQVIGIAGDVKAWHPHLASAVVLVTPGTFSESSVHAKHLQPRRPIAVAGTRIETFLAKFSRSIDDSRGDDHIKRAIASVDAEQEPSDIDMAGTFKGSRGADDVLEEQNEESLEILQAHLSGQDYDEERNSPLAVSASPFDGRGRGLAGLTDEVRGPRFEVTGTTKKDVRKLEADEKLLLEKLAKKPRY